MCSRDTAYQVLHADAVEVVLLLHVPQHLVQLKREERVAAMTLVREVQRASEQSAAAEVPKQMHEGVFGLRDGDAGHTQLAAVHSVLAETLLVDWSHAGEFLPGVVNLLAEGLECLPSDRPGPKRSRRFVGLLDSAAADADLVDLLLPRN